MGHSRSGELDNLVSEMDNMTLFIMKIMFVMVVIFITHKIYTFCTSGNKSRGTASSSASKTASKASPNASTAHQGSGPPNRDPPSYESIYPDLSKELNAAKKVGGGGGLFSWLFGSGSNGAKDLVFQRIADQFYSVDEVSNAIRQSGLESSNLIFGK